MGNKTKILYVDHEVHNLTAFRANFRLEYEIFLCQSEKEGLEILMDKEIPIVIADQRMPNIIGIEFLEEFESRYSEPIKVVVTAHRDIKTLEYAFERGLIFKYHEKPWNLMELRKTIESAYTAYGNTVN